jgi:amino acid transporter
VAKATGNGHFTGITSWLTYSANAIVTAMVAVSFGSYAASTFAGGNAAWIKVFAALIIIVATAVNIAGSGLVAKAQTVIVYVVLGILAFFAWSPWCACTRRCWRRWGTRRCGTSVSGVALTFFAFLGFGIITFTAKDLARPSRQLPRAMYLALSIATVIYIAVSLNATSNTTSRTRPAGGAACATATPCANDNHTGPASAVVRFSFRPLPPGCE